MTPVVDIFVVLLREAWLALTSALLVVVLLALLAQVLRVASASALGARFWVWEAVAAGLALLLLALFAFLGVPLIIQAAQSAIPSGAGCGPLGDLGTLAAGLLAALTALRLLKGLVAAVSAAAVGAGVSLSSTLLEAGEAVLGMVLAAAAIPIAAHFLGVC